MAVTVLAPAGVPQAPRLPGGNRAQGPYSSLGPGGYSRPPYADFSTKVSPKSGFFSTLGAGGYPRRPYVTSLFGTKVSGTTFSRTINVVCTSTTTIAATKAFLHSIAVTCTSTTTPWLKGVGKGVAVACTSTTAFLKSVAHRITVACTTSTTVAAIKVFLRTITVVCTSTTTIATVRAFARSVAVTCTSTTTNWLKGVGKGVPVVCTSTTAFLKSVAKTIALACTSTTTVAAIRVFLRTVNVVCTSTTTNWLKSVGKAVPVVCTSTTSWLKSVGKRITVACTSTTTIAALKVRVVTITVTCTSTTSMLTSVTRAPVTGGVGGERPRRGYSWKWSDFNDQAWFQAFREEFYRLKRLKNPKRRREELVKLEKALTAAVEEHTGERLTGALPDTEFYDHVAEGLALLAAEIEDEEAFLLLT